MIAFVNNGVLLFKAPVIIKNTFIAEVRITVEPDTVAVVTLGANTELIGVLNLQTWGFVDNLPSQGV